MTPTTRPPVQQPRNPNRSALQLAASGACTAALALALVSCGGGSAVPTAGPLLQPTAAATAPTAHATAAPASTAATAATAAAAAGGVAAAAPVSADCAARRGVAGYDVVLLAGQSNMVGGGRGWVAAIDGATDPRIDQLDSNSLVIGTASNPLAHPTRETGQSVGLGMSFAAAYLQTLPAQRKVLLVPAAYNGSGFGASQWNPGDPQFALAVANMKVALAKGSGNCVAALLWHQGEADAQLGASQASHAANLDRMLAALRQQIPGAATAPFVLGELSPEWIADATAGQVGVSAAIDALPARMPYTAIASNVGLRSNRSQGIDDVVHYDAASQRAQGQRYFDALKLALANAGPPVSADCAGRRGAAGYDVVLLVGQSNMVGIGRGYTPAYDGVANARIDQTDSASGAIVPASNPLLHPNRQDFNAVGLGLSFATSYLQTLPANRKVLLVPSAFGGTGFADNNWNPGNTLFEDAVRRAKAALGGNAGSCLAAILWHQGENDASAGATQAQHAANLDRLIATLRARIPGAAQAPFVLGDMVPEWLASNTAGQLAVTAAIDATPQRMPLTAVAPSAGFTSNRTQGVDDPIHFDAASQRAFGLRYYAALNAALGNSAPPAGVRQTAGAGLLAQYFANPTLAGAPALQRTEAPNFDWGGGSPAPELPADYFSVRWSGFIQAAADGVTRLQVLSDDGVRVWVDNQLVVDRWTTHPPTVDTVAVTLSAAKRTQILVEYFERDGGATLRLNWQPPGAAAFVPVPTSALTPGRPASQTNLALNRPASQSSTGFGGDARRAVDGNTDGAYFNGSVSHSGNGAPQDWWQVDLGASKNHIDVVTVWNRTDCCADRLQRFDLLVSDTDMTGRSAADLNADPGVTVRSVIAPPAPFVNIPVGGPGRFVRVQLAGQNYLSLAEVQVWGSTGVERARGLAARQSSTAFGGDASRAVDGNTDGVYNNQSVTHTGGGVQDFWEVDLGRTGSVDSVTVWNRTDCCADRLQNFSVFVSDADMSGLTYDELRANPAVAAFTFTAPPAPKRVIPVAGRGRYVRLQQAGQQPLSLAEVQVSGNGD